jgi:hypothetical protein
MTTALRPLPRSLDPLPGESLAGFLLRLAHRLAISPAHLAVITGLTTSMAAIPISRMLALDAGTADTFARAARLSAGEAHALTLARYARCYPPAGPGRRRAPASAATTWQLTTSSRYCPACLAGDGSPVQQQHGGAWKALWQLPVIFACTSHQRPLRHLCPACSRPASVRRSPGLSLISRPGYSGLHPGQSRHPATYTTTGAGRRTTGACGARLDLIAAPDPPAGWAPLMRFQQHIHDLLHASASTPTLSIGAPTTPARYFTDLRIIARLITASWPAAQPLLSTGHAPLITGHADAISQQIRRTRGINRADSSAFRLYDRPPADPVTCGMLLLLASQILSAADIATATQLLRPLAQASSPSWEWLTRRQAGGTTCSDALQEILSAVRPAQPAPSARLAPPARRTPVTQPGQPINLPGSLWKQARTRQILKDRDIQALLRLINEHGPSQHRIGQATRLSQGRVSEIMNGSRTVTALQTFQNIADGLSMPDEARMLLGLAPKRTSPAPAG